ncbi:hypothetical protein TSMEX_011289 [Taenia solium]
MPRQLSPQFIEQHFWLDRFGSAEARFLTIAITSHESQLTTSGGAHLTCLRMCCHLYYYIQQTWLTLQLGFACTWIAAFYSYTRKQMCRHANLLLLLIIIQYSCDCQIAFLVV